MKKRHLLFSLMFFLFLSVISTAQPGNANCGACTLDTDCPTTMPDGGLCPSIIPDGQVGEAYDFSVTFYMPQTITVTDPITSDVNLENVEITDMINLPSGLEWTCSTPDCTYQPTSNPPDSESGCIRICGTPNAAPGVYEINVRLLADVFVVALGSTLPDQEQFYTATITILPPDVPIDYNVLTGCGSLSDDLEAIQDFNPDQPTSWVWDIDGQISEGKQASYEFTSPGDYDIILETTVRNYAITDLCLNLITGGYCGDVEEVTCDCEATGICPDPYIEILGSNLPTADGVDSYCWNDISIEISTDSIRFKAYDEDLGSPFGSQDDLLGIFITYFDIADFVNGETVYDFSNGNLSGSITVSSVVSSVTTDTLTVTVYELPETPVIGQDADQLFVANDDAHSVQWYLDGAIIDGATGNTVDITDAGAYSVVFTSADDCTSTSEAYSTALDVDNIITDAKVSALYPNPAEETISLTIDYLNSHDMQLNIMDALGKSVYQSNKTAQAGQQIYTVDVSEMPSGLYFVQIRLDDGSQMTQKLTIL